jgi:hypothetical protein
MRAIPSGWICGRGGWKTRGCCRSSNAAAPVIPTLTGRPMRAAEELGEAVKVNAVASLSLLRCPVVVHGGSSPSRRAPRESLCDSCGVNTERLKILRRQNTETLKERDRGSDRIGLAPQGRGGGECGAVGAPGCGGGAFARRWRPNRGEHCVASKASGTGRTLARRGKALVRRGRPWPPAASAHRYGRIATRMAGAVLGDRVPPTQFRRATPSRARLWWLASASPRRLVVNPVRAGRQQRQRRCRVPEPELVRAAS